MSHTHKIAWCAGFFDGEGFITIQKRKAKAKNGKTYEGHYLHIGINHVAPKPLIEFQKLLGGKITYYDKVTGNRKPRHQWKASCQEAANILKQLLPYFHNKEVVAKLGIELQETMGNFYKVPQEIVEKRQQIREQITYLNAQD